jgi:type I restriction-modification system DNA methylase subunit
MTRSRLCVYDPRCGSGGMFVSSEKFIEAHSGKLGDISIYGQESNYTTWRLAKMNLAIRGIDAQIAHGDTFHNDSEMVAVRAKLKAGQSLRGIARDLGVSAALLVKRAKTRN